jgi:peptidyl-tRNA hydrolase, PTH2 family
LEREIAMDNSSRPKQVIVIRKDLNCRKGKWCAQVAHAAMKVFFDMGQWVPDNQKGFSNTFLIPNLTPPMIEWMKGAFTKVVVGVNSEDIIYQLAEKAREAGIPHAVIVDSGFTEFHGNKTTTCLAIGPDLAEKIDKITGDLELI